MKSKKQYNKYENMGKKEEILVSPWEYLQQIIFRRRTMCYSVQELVPRQLMDVEAESLKLTTKPKKLSLNFIFQYPTIWLSTVPTAFPFTRRTSKHITELPFSIYYIDALDIVY